MQPISAGQGKIQKILLSFESRNIKRLLTVYASLISQMKDDVEFIIFVPKAPRKESFIKKTGQKDGIAAFTDAEKRPESLIDRLSRQLAKRILTTSNKDAFKDDKRAEQRLRRRIREYFHEAPIDLMDLLDSMSETVGDLNTMRVDRQRLNRIDRWVQDYFCVQETESGSIPLIEPGMSALFKAKPVGIQFLAENLALSDYRENYSIIPSSFRLRGGNMLSSKLGPSRQLDRTFSLIGPNDLVQHMRVIARRHRVKIGTKGRGKYRLLYHLLIEEMKRRLGTDQVLYAGYSDQRMDEISSLAPFPHLDLYVSLGGIADEREEPQLVFVGDAVEELNGCKRIRSRSQRKKKLDLMAEWFEEQNRADLSFKVVRLPLVAIRNRYLFSWNNCLLESYRSGGEMVRKAYLPDYELDQIPRNFRCIVEAAQKLAVSIYEREGFEVHLIKGEYGRLARQRGSLHCLAKVLKRSGSYSL